MKSLDCQERTVERRAAVVGIATSIETELKYHVEQVTIPLYMPESANQKYALKIYQNCVL